MKSLKTLLTILVILFTVNHGWTYGSFESKDQAQQMANSWATKAPMPTPRGEVTAATFDGKIYVIGGQSYSANYKFRTVEVYDPATNTWTTKADMPTARCSLAAVELNGKIYAIGGNGSGSVHLNNVEEYDPATNTWTVKAGMIRSRHALAAVSANGKIYAVGGIAGTKAYSSVEEYDPKTNTWTEWNVIPEVRFASRNFHAAAYIDGNIYYTGGYFDGSGNTDKTFKYNIAANTLTELAVLPQWAGDLAAVSLGGKAYFMGGYSNKLMSALQVFDPVKGSWEQKTPMPTARTGLAAAVAGGKIYAIGGWNGNLGDLKDLSLVEEYTPDLTSANTTFGIETDIQVFPNPTTGKLQIITPDNEPIKQAEVFSIQGQKLSSINFPESNSVDLSKLKTGIYILKLVIGEKIVIREMVKN
jgi:N-acetylneuraminic acid mutarotase